MELRQKITKLLIKCTLSLLFFITSIILLNNNYTFSKYYSILFANNIDFSYFRSKTKSVLNKLILNKDLYVSSEKFRYIDVKKYNNSYIFTVDTNYIINNIKGGTVCFIGNKEGLGNTIIVESENVTIMYSNIENINVNLYDYVNEGIILGNSIENIIILTFKNEDNYISYENFV